MSFVPPLLTQSPCLLFLTLRLQGGLDLIQNHLLCPCLLVGKSIEYLMCCLGVQGVYPCDWKNQSRACLTVGVALDSTLIAPPCDHLVGAPV